MGNIINRPFVRIMDEADEAGVFLKMPYVQYQDEPPYSEQRRIRHSPSGRTATPVWLSCIDKIINVVYDGCLLISVSVELMIASFLIIIVLSQLTPLLYNTALYIDFLFMLLSPVLLTFGRINSCSNSVFLFL